MKILREISVKERLPETEGIYTVHIHEDSHTSAIYFFTEGNVWGGGFGVTSWYEEVSIEELDLTMYQLFRVNENEAIEAKIKLKAKERYEKALMSFTGEIMPDENWVLNVYGVNVIKALKIASGLETE